MKKFIVFLSALIIIGLSACVGDKQKSGNPEVRAEQKDDRKIPVTYFSATGNTAKAAHKIADASGADIMEIEPVQPYTDADLDWHDKQSRSSVEMNDPKSRPQIKTPTRNVTEYDVVLIGYPIWWDLAPREINTFIESCDLNGKAVVPFATSGGSVIDGSVVALKREYPGLDWRDGRLLNDAGVKAISQWLESL